MEVEQIKKFLKDCGLDGSLKLTTHDDSYWRLDQLIRHAFEIDAYNRYKALSEVAPKEKCNCDPYFVKSMVVSKDKFLCGDCKKPIGTVEVAPKEEKEENCPMCDNPKEKDGHNCCEECGGIPL